jgi:ribosome-binding ATPase YchF (GTP1/OBG family)
LLSKGNQNHLFSYVVQKEYTYDLQTEPTNLVHQNCRWRAKPIVYVNNIEKSLNSAEKRTMKALCNIKEKESNEDAI